MRRISSIIAVALLSATLLTGCGGKKEASKDEHKLSNNSANSQMIANLDIKDKVADDIDKKVPILEKYTLPKNYDDTKATSQDKFGRQMQMNALGDMKPGIVDFKLITLKYESDGSITGFGAIRNSTGKVAFEVGIPTKLKTQDGKIVAVGNFYSAEKEYGDIENGVTLLIPIRFETKDVKIQGVELNKCNAEYEAHYFQK